MANIGRRETGKSAPLYLPGKSKSVFDFSHFLLNSDFCCRLTWYKSLSLCKLTSKQISRMYFAFFCLEGSLHHHSAQLASSSEPYLHFQPYSPWGLFLTIVCHIQNVKGTLNSMSKPHQ